MGDLTGPSADATAGAALPTNPATAADPAALDRYTALVAALLGVRTDYASARFDAEVTAALAANRLDVATARTLRWWQRASVREVEGYTGSVLPVVLATRTHADTAAAIETDESAASWQRAQTITPAPAPSTVAGPAADTVVVPEAAAAPAAPDEAPRQSRVITIPDPSTRRRSAKEIQQAVREALRATAAPMDPGLPFDVPSPQNASSHGRDRGDHAHSAPTA
jgi:hypothetical protein